MENWGLADSLIDVVTALESDNDNSRRKMPKAFTEPTIMWGPKELELLKDKNSELYKLVKKWLKKASDAEREGDIYSAVRYYLRALGHSDDIAKRKAADAVKAMKSFDLGLSDIDSGAFQAIQDLISNTVMDTDVGSLVKVKKVFTEEPSDPGVYVGRGSRSAISPETATVLADFFKNVYDRLSTEEKLYFTFKLLTGGFSGGGRTLAGTEDIEPIISAVSRVYKIPYEEIIKEYLDDYRQAAKDLYRSKRVKMGDPSYAGLFSTWLYAKAGKPNPPSKKFAQEFEAFKKAIGGRIDRRMTKFALPEKKVRRIIKELPEKIKDLKKLLK